MIHIDGLTARQKIIADLLWEAQETDELVGIMLAFGKEEVVVVKEMIVAATYDQMEDTDIANDYLKRFTNAS